MPIQLIKNDERLSLTIDGSTFFYRRIKSHDASMLRDKHTQRGEFKVEGFGKELLERYVLGWDNVYEGKKKAEFKPEYLESLESPIKTQLIAAINGDRNPTSTDMFEADEIEKK